MIELIYGAVIYEDNECVVRMINSALSRVIHVHIKVEGREVIPHRYKIGQNRLYHGVY